MTSPLLRKMPIDDVGTEPGAAGWKTTLGVRLLIAIGVGSFRCPGTPYVPFIGAVFSCG